MAIGLTVPAGPALCANADAAGQRDADLTALRNIRPMAEEGDVFAQLALGVMFLYGWNTPRDYVQARKWFNLASWRSAPGPDHDTAVRGCDLAAANMTPAQIDEAEKLTQLWFEDLSRRNAARP